MSEADFLRGFAIAMRGLIKEFDQPAMAKDIITSNGLELADFEGIVRRVILKQLERCGGRITQAEIQPVRAPRQMRADR